MKNAEELTTTEIIKELRNVATWKSKPRLRELVMELIKKYEFLQNGLIEIINAEK